MLNILITSDLHYGNGERPTVAVVKTIINNIRPDCLNLVIAVGDLTANGYDGVVTCGCLFSCLGPNTSITGGNKSNQLQLFKDNFMKPILNVDTDNVRVCLVHGNHDRYNGASRFPVLDYIKKRHGNTYYMYHINGIYFIFCGMYPDHGICQWIKSLKLAHDEPIICTFHYNLAGEMSDSWSEQAKEEFYATIKPYNVLAIYVGHLHYSYINQYKGITVLSGAGSQIGNTMIGSDMKPINRLIPLTESYFPLIDPNHLDG
jgi:predicted phosphodiesterase